MGILSGSVREGIQVGAVKQENEDWGWRDKALLIRSPPSVASHLHEQDFKNGKILEPP